MKWNAAYGVSTVVTLALATLLAGQAHADCSGSQSISHEDASCLDVSWDNNIDALSNGRVTATNTCASYGNVVVKIERPSCPAIYKTLWTGVEYEIGTRRCDVEEVFCCKDRSDLCNISDVVTEDSCLDQFSKSPASETCTQVTATVPSLPFHGSDSDPSGDCDISAHCEAGGPGLQFVGITADWLDVPDIRNCVGVLKLGGC